MDNTCNVCGEFLNTEGYCDNACEESLEVDNTSETRKNERKATTKMISCPECGRESPWYRTHCDKCNIFLEDAILRQKMKERPSSNESLLETCHNCKQQFSKRASVCPKCKHEQTLKCFVCKKQIVKSSDTCPECGDPDPFEKLTEKSKKISLKGTDNIISKVELVKTYTSNHTNKKTLSASVTQSMDTKLYEAILGEKNKNYYLTKFKQFDKKGSGLKASWNWAALWVLYPWLIYRKMYGWFFIFLLTETITGILIKVASLDLGSIVGFLQWIGFATFSRWIGFAIFSNSLYQNNLRKKIAKAKRNNKDENKLIEYLRKKGGVNTWVVWVVVIPIVGIIAAILIPMFARK